MVVAVHRNAGLDDSWTQTRSMNGALIGQAQLASAQSKSSEGLSWTLRLGGDFFSLMLCCLLILLAYILSLPSLRQQANRGKEPESPHGVLLSPNSERRVLCVFVCVCVNCWLLLVQMLKWTQTERERESNTHRRTCTHTHTWFNCVGMYVCVRVWGGGAELVVAHRSISGSSDKILRYYTSELQMMQCWELEQGGAVGGGV